MAVEMDQEIKIEPVESDCLFEHKKENFIKVENVFEQKSETNESAVLEDPLKVSSDAQGGFSCKNEIKSKISNVNQNCSKSDNNHPIKAEEEEDKIPKTNAQLTFKQLKEIVRKGQEFTDLIKELDPNVERQSKIIEIIDDCLKCYKEEAKEKSKNDAKQTNVHNFFTKLSSKPKESARNSFYSNSGQKSGGPKSEAQEFEEGKIFENKVVHERKSNRLEMTEIKIWKGKR